MATVLRAALSLCCLARVKPPSRAIQRVWAGSKKHRPDVAQIASIPQKGAGVSCRCWRRLYSRAPSKGPCGQHPCIPGPVLAQCPQTLPYHSFKEPQQSCKQPRKLPREGRGHDASQPATDVKCEGKAQSLLVRPCHELGILLGSHSQ